MTGEMMIMMRMATDVKNDFDRLDSKEKVQLTATEKKLKKEVWNQRK